jgi:hypothetical protein
MVRDVEAIRGEIARRGFAVLDTTLGEFEILAGVLGGSVSVRHRGPAIDRLVPTDVAAAAPHSLSAVFGLGEFPFHTDAAHHSAPPRYLLLRLAEGSTTDTPTLIVDGRPSELSCADVKTLTRETWLVRGGGTRTFYAPILDTSRMMLRFDPGCMTEPTGTRLTGRQLLRDWLARSSVEEIRWVPGATLVADNWRVLHSRPALGPNDKSRALLRKLVV